MLQIGTDPELFVSKGGEIVSVVGLLGGTKDHPVSLGNGFAVQEDNVLAEFNTPPVLTKQEFIHNHTFMLDKLDEMLGGVSIQSSYEFTKAELRAGGLQAMRFGCSPDINAWTKRTNKAPSPFTLMRSAGGHAHFGYPNPSEEINYQLAKLADVFVSIPGVVMEPDCKRRSLYGKAGSMRHKPYGFEYRTPSNFWLKSEARMGWMFDQCHKAYNLVDDTTVFIDEAGGGEEIQRIVNTNDVGAALKVCARMGIEYVA